jgi:hypothetical protein
MDKMTSIGDAKLVVAPIAMAVLAVSDVKRVTKHLRVTQLDVPVVIGSKESHVQRQAPFPILFADGRLGEA